PPDFLSSPKATGCNVISLVRGHCNLANLTRRLQHRAPETRSNLVRPEPFSLRLMFGITSFTSLTEDFAACISSSPPSSRSRRQSSCTLRHLSTEPFSTIKPDHRSLAPLS